MKKIEISYEQLKTKLKYKKTLEEIKLAVGNFEILPSTITGYQGYIVFYIIGGIYLIPYKRGTVGLYLSVTSLKPLNEVHGKDFENYILLFPKEEKIIKKMKKILEIQKLRILFKKN